MTQTYSPVNQMCVHPDGGCSYRRHSGSTRDGRSSLQRWASPSRIPVWSRSGRCRCHRVQEGNLYVPHTEGKRPGKGEVIRKMLYWEVAWCFSPETFRKWKWIFKNTDSYIKCQKQVLYGGGGEFN